MVLVGATFVGTIHLDVAEGDFVEKGQQIAKFSFGGSMCVLLLKKNFKLDEDLYFPKGEVLVKMGQSLAQS
jgi:phosphatidylserine decarboxylase